MNIPTSIKTARVHFQITQNDHGLMITATLNDRFRTHACISSIRIPRSRRQLNALITRANNAVLSHSMDIDDSFQSWLRWLAYHQAHNTPTAKINRYHAVMAARAGRQYHKMKGLK